jgi:hypothetical protein
MGTESTESESVQSSQQPLWERPNFVPWSTQSIPVCFDPNVPSDLRTRIRGLVEGSWERVAELDFSAWGDCPSPLPTGNQVVVLLNPNLPEGVLGNTNWCDDPATCVTTVEFPHASPPDRTVVHEFGHVLGFTEENTEDCLQYSGPGTSLEWEGDVGVSVMTQSICSSSATLSAWDIMGVRLLYGAKAKGSIAGLGGLVLNIHGAVTDYGAPITGWPSWPGAWNESFVRLADSTLLLFATSDSGVLRCLNVAGGVVGSGLTPLISWECVDAENEEFDFKGVAWLAMGNRCVQAAKKVAGAKLSIRECNSSSSLQKWDFLGLGGSAIVLSGTNLCVTVPNGSQEYGNELKLYTCNSGGDGNINYQHFQFDRGHIVYGDKCFNVLGGTTANGARIGLWDGCYGGYVNELFTLRGPITVMGQCVDMSGGSPYDGVPIGVSPCTGSASQVWEYYF